MALYRSMIFFCVISTELIYTLCTSFQRRAKDQKQYMNEITKKYFARPKISPTTLNAQPNRE